PSVPRSGAVGPVRCGRAGCAPKRTTTGEPRERPQRGSTGPDRPPVDLRTRLREVGATSAEAGAAADRGRGSGSLPDGCVPITAVKPSPPRPSPAFNYPHRLFV